MAADDAGHYVHAMRTIQRSRQRLVVARESHSPASSDQSVPTHDLLDGSGQASRKRRLSLGGFQGLLRSAFGGMIAPSPCKRPRSELFLPNEGEFARMARGLKLAIPNPAECAFLFAVRDLHRKERAARKPVLPRYSEILSVLIPGDRRRAANIILAAAAKMDLESCTPTCAVLLMDRFLSHLGKAVPSSSLAYTALMCLNVAGKIHDLDTNFFGTRRYMTLVRDCIKDPAAKQRDVVQFMRVAESTEQRILRVLESELTSTPPALEYIHLATGWGPRSEDREQLDHWQACVFLCDMFATYTEATDYTQVEIARAVLRVLGYEPASPGGGGGGGAFEHAAERMREATRQFFACAGSSVAEDPYAGVRMRHSLHLGALLLVKELVTGSRAGSAASQSPPE